MRWAVIILSTFVMTSAHAEIACFDLFSLKPISDPLEELVRFESEFTAFTSPLYTFGAPTPEKKALELIVPQIDELQKEYEGVFEKLETASAPEQQRNIDELFEKLEKLKASSRPQAIAQEPTKLSELIQDPSKVKANVFYEVQGIDPFVERVIFSEDIVSEVFQKKIAQYQHASTYILRAIMRGKVGHHEIGITQFVEDSLIYKVRIIGESGFVRIAGFFIGRDYYAVAISTNPDHGIGPMKRLMEEVRRQKQKRGF